MKDGLFQTREIEVAGTEERCTVYSPDGRNWWSDKRDVIRYRRRRCPRRKKADRCITPGRDIGETLRWVSLDKPETFQKWSRW
jgi:hypothetical protein